MMEDTQEFWPRPIPCASEDHAKRAKLKDGLTHSDDLGTYTGVLPPQSFCPRCARYEEATRAERAAAKDAAAAEAFKRLKTATGMTSEELVLALAQLR